MGASHSITGAPTSILERLVTGAHRLPFAVKIALCVLFFSLPYVLAFFDGSLSRFLETGEWRFLLLEPVMVFYMLAIAPTVIRAERNVIDALRSISQLDDAEFDRIVASTTHIRPRSEALAILLGVLFEFMLFGPQSLSMSPSLFRVYLFVANLVVFGLMGWLIFVSLAGNRCMAALHRQPLTVNIFDLTPFEPIGRQSLVICLAFIGGSIISLFFVFSPSGFLSFTNLVIYGTLSMVIILLFFVNLWRTHVVLARAKQNALSTAQQHISRIYQSLASTAVASADMSATSAEVNTWITLEHRLKLARTWPYNTEMLRTLFISAMVPLLLALVRFALSLFSQYAFHL